MRKFIIGAGVGVLVPTLTLSGATLYLYPELRYNPKQFELAFMRVYRVIKAGTKMAYIYVSKPYQPMEEKHLQAAEELRFAFQRNTGLYIKFGQILASVWVSPHLSSTSSSRSSIARPSK